MVVITATYSIPTTEVNPKRPYVDRSSNYKCSPNDKSLNAELYGLGRTLKHLQPPGGSESGVFDAYRKPLKELPSRKNVKDNFKSYVFQGPYMSPPHRVIPLEETTLYKLFQKPPSAGRRSLRNRFKSTAFDLDPPKKPMQILIVKRDPITGCNCQITDEEKKLRKRIIRNPITFEGITERFIPSRCRQPPGGTSSLILEYDESPRPF